MIDCFATAARGGVIQAAAKTGENAACMTPPRRGIVVPTYAGRRGHPVLLAATYRDEIMTGYDQVGLRGLFAAHADDVQELPVSASEALSDMDYPEDYQRELARSRGTGR